MDEMEDLAGFLKLDSSEDVASEAILSKQYHVAIGGFGSVEGVRTFACSLRVADLKEDLTTFEKLIDDKNWPVSQIIQREVDPDRIEKIARNYVLNKGKLVKYFPPLTIAILPLDSTGRIAPHFEYEVKDAVDIRREIFKRSSFAARKESYNDNEKLFLESKNISLVDGLYVLQISKSANFNILTWDTRKYCFVVIDGQHRFDSLLRAMVLDSEVGNFLQDVVFLDLSKLLNGKQEKIVRAVRRIFVDVNTEAKDVTLVRRILMEDKDLAALLVQSLIDDDQENGDSRDFLPPQIVDWHGENLKHSLPHVTGVLVLHQLIGSYFLTYNVATIADLQKPKLVKAWVGYLNDRFGIDRKIEDDVNYSSITKLSDSLSRYSEATDNVGIEGDIDPIDGDFFIFDYRVLDIAKTTFEKIYRRAIVKFFTDLEPYKQLIDFLRENGAFDNTKNLCKALVSSSKKIESSSVLSSKMIEIRKSAANRFSKFEVLYLVVFQKAIFSVLMSRIDKEFRIGFSAKDANRVVVLFVEEFNYVLNVIELADPDFFANYKSYEVTSKSPKVVKRIRELGNTAIMFWENILLWDSRVVYNTQGVRSLVKLVELMIRMAKFYRDNSSPKVSKDEFAIPYFLPRSIKSLGKIFPDHADEEIESLAQFILDSRYMHLDSLIQRGVEKLKQK